MKNILSFFCAVVLFFAAPAVTAQTICSNPKCHGGRIFCNECAGVGKVKNETCRICEGKGTYPCPKCGGTGTTTGTGNDSSNRSNSNNTGDVNVGGSSSYHQFKCPNCGGRGEVPKSCPNPKCHNGAIFCETCDYTGIVNKTCTACSGAGEVTTHRKYPCPECKGMKYVTQEKLEKCTCRNGKVPAPNRPSKAQNSETVWVNHTACNGTGYITVKVKVTCPKCNGRAYMIEREATTVRCDSCGGSGRIKETCPECDGKRSYVCPDCKGYGNVREKCSRCNGNGVIYTD